MPDTTDLYTVVKNVSGATRFFGYLGPKGRSLASAGTYSVFGNLWSQPGWTPQKQAAFERDLLAGRLEVMHSPLQVLQDTAPTTIITNPSVQATNAGTGSGATLAAGYYKTAYTFVNTWGQTTVGTSLSAAYQATDDKACRVTTPDPASVSASSINVYMTAMAATAGAVDAATLRKVGSVASGATTLDVTALPAIDGTHPAPPTANTTTGPAVQGVKSTAGALAVVDPSWGRYTG